MQKNILGIDYEVLLAMDGTVFDSTRTKIFHPPSLAQAMTYNSDGMVDSITVGPTIEGWVFKQTLTYVGMKLTTMSAWIYQP